eukprot:3009489-Rhodomonas_salina.1
MIANIRVTGTEHIHSKPNLKGNASFPIPFPPLNCPGRAQWTGGAGFSDTKFCGPTTASACSVNSRGSAGSETTRTRRPYLISSVAIGAPFSASSTQMSAGTSPSVAPTAS